MDSEAKCLQQGVFTEAQKLHFSTLKLRLTMTGFLNQVALIAVEEKLFLY